MRSEANALNGDGSQRILFVGITNNVHAVHPDVVAVFRHHVQVTRPSLDERVKLFQHYLREQPELTVSVELKTLADRTSGCTGADIAAIVQHAVHCVYDRNMTLSSSATDSSTRDTACARVSSGAEREPSRLPSLEHGLRQLSLTETSSLDHFAVTTTDVLEAITALRVGSLLVPAEPSLTPAELTERKQSEPTRTRIGLQRVGGLQDVKQQLRELVIWPINQAGLYRSMGLRPPQGTLHAITFFFLMVVWQAVYPAFTQSDSCLHPVDVCGTGLLIYGPSGTGKTLLAGALAEECGMYLLSVSIAELMRSGVGESEKFLANLFAQARARAPCLLFFDEFQAIFGHGRHESGSWGSKMISQFLLEFDRLGTLSARTVDRPPVPSSADRGTDREVPLVLVMAATNAPHSIDTALLRPGRFDNLIYVGLPDDDGRREILQAVRARMSQRAARTRVLATHPTAGDKACDLWHLSEDAWTELVQATHGYSGWSHVMIVCCSCLPDIKISLALCSLCFLELLLFQCELSSLFQVLIWRSCVMPLVFKQ